MKSQRNGGRQSGHRRCSLAPSSSSTHAANASSISSGPASHISSPEVGWGAAVAATQAATGCRSTEHREPLAPAPAMAGCGSVALQHQPRPTSHLPAQRTRPASGPESLAPRAGPACRDSAPPSQEAPAAPAGSPQARRPSAQLRRPASAARADGPVKAEEEEGLRGFVTRREFLAVEQELGAVQEELKRLRWKVRHVGETVPPLAEESKRYNGYTLTELRAMARSEEDPHQAAQKILTALFSDAPLLQRCAPGPARPTRSLPQPGVDSELCAVYCHILQSIFPGTGGPSPRERTQQV